MEVDYSKIDEGVRDLVHILNDIPFVETVASCEGHLRFDCGFPGIYPDKGCGFLYDGSMLFNMDESHPESKNFIKDVKNLENKYCFVDFAGPDGDVDCYSLFVDPSDLTQEKMINDNDSFRKTICKQYQVPIAVGEKRVKEYKQVWSDFLEIAKKYVAKSDLR
jgi:hypothetical protein